MSPWAQAVFDTLGALVTSDVMDEVLDRGMLEVLPLTHIRGRSLHDSFVIVDEAQSLERNVLLTVLSRIGSGSRVVLTHDIAQRDNLRVGRLSPPAIAPGPPGLPRPSPPRQPPRAPPPPPPFRVFRHRGGRAPFVLLRAQGPPRQWSIRWWSGVKPWLTPHSTAWVRLPTSILR